MVYVGKGTAGRAWACGHSSGAKHGRGNRTKVHQDWIFDLLQRGYTPDDFVEIALRRNDLRDPPLSAGDLCQPSGPDGEGQAKSQAQ